MSGGILTRYEYDLCRLNEWARNIRYEAAKSSCTEDEKPYLGWLANLLDNLSECLSDVDMALSGDSGKDNAINVIKTFKKRWSEGKGAVTDEELINNEEAGN